MKKYIYLLTLSLIFFSCDERLDLNPYGSTGAEVALVTPADFENAINGMYTQMESANYYGANFMSFPDVLTDNLIYNPDGRQTQRVTYEWRYNANATQGAFMAQAYRVIQQANFILENIDRLEEGSQKNNIRAQALAGRALSHFNLCNLFGKIPTQSADAGSALGMPYLTSSAIRQTAARNTVSEVYDNIITDLQTAANQISSENGIERFNRNAVYGLLSRVHLYAGNMPDVVTAANQVTASVSTTANFPGIWDDSSDDGVLFELKNFDADTNVSTGVPYSQTLTDGIYSEYVVEFGLNNLYQPSDIRRFAYIDTSPFSDTGIYNHVAKYLSSSVNTGSGVVDSKVIRAAEVQLNKAEALASMTGQDGAALAALDLVRSNRYAGFVSGGETGQALKDAIQLERRLELAFEGHRFFDVKRQGLPINRTNAGEFFDGTGTPPLFLTLTASDHRFQLPIPKSEIDVNPNMEQNPGY